MIALRDFVPPIVHKVRNRLRARRLPAEEEVFADYESAARHCTADGWNDRDFASVVVRDAMQLRDRAIARPAQLPILELRAIAAIGWVLSDRVERARLRVVDFGGSAGWNYFVAKALFDRPQLEWTVVETEALVAASAPLSNDELRFVNDVAAIQQEVDLVFSVGALQYHPRPLDALRALIALDPSYIVLFRTAMIDANESFCAVQCASLSRHLKGELPMDVADVEMRYPVTFVPRAAVREALWARYDIIAEIDEGVLNPVGPRGVHGYGVLCKRRFEARLRR